MFSISFLHSKLSTYVRALVRAGATGAWAPAKIWQWVQGTRPDEDALLLNKKNATNWVLGISKPYIKYELYQIWVKMFCKNKIFEIRGPHN